MDRNSFRRRFDECRVLLGTQDRLYRSGSLWSKVGRHPLDLRLTLLAELFWDSNDKQRQQIRASVDKQDAWALVAYVRRIGILINSRDDIRWLRAGLAIAVIEDARFDFRDLIVSLVILRFAAERMGIDTKPYFDEVIKVSTARTRGVLRNVRNHSKADILITVREFGPRDWNC
jgi:hypothetical protein